MLRKQGTVKVFKFLSHSPKRPVNYVSLMWHKPLMLVSFPTVSHYHMQDISGYGGVHWACSVNGPGPSCGQNNGGVSPGNILQGW